MRLVTANIGRNTSVGRVQDDIRKIHRLAPSAIVGFQEIDEADPAEEHKILRNVLAEDNRLVGMATKVPVSVPRGKYNVVRINIIRAAAGIPNISPTRFITEVVLQDKKNPKIVFVVLNLHYPAGAWNSKTHERAEAERDEAWASTLAAHKRRVKHWHDKGVTVFWVGDVNRMAMPKVHPKEVQVITAGIDSVSFIEGDVKVKVVRTGTITLFSDHDAKWVDFALSI